LSADVTVALDAMSGDHGPSVVVRGAVSFFEDTARGTGDGVRINLVGDRDVLSRHLGRHGAKLPIDITHAPQVIGMDEHPAEALKKKPKSSIAVMAGLQKKGVAQAMVSPGNTGAMMAASLFALGRLPGIARPAIAATLPSEKDPTVVLDVGANVGCRPAQLRQFAFMGSAYSRGVFGVDRPRVALLNVGSERTKGTPTLQEAYGMLEETDLNFAGNIEGDGLLKGEADVVVCDGLEGNILLKITESIADLIGGSLYLEMRRHWFTRAGFLMMKPAFSQLWRSLDSAEYGGAPLLGLDGVSIVAHGSSNAKAICNAIRAACDFHRSGVNELIGRELGGMDAS
jgi:glycerol-3-phosphate acyltransferase PlsX